MIKLIITYAILQTIYVILNTISSIWKIKAGKMLASISSAVCYAVYVFVLIYTVADFNIWVKAGLVAGTNFVGVYVSRIITEKLRKDKLWEITATVSDDAKAFYIEHGLRENNIGFNTLKVNDNCGSTVFHIYSKNQKESVIIKSLLANNYAKYIVHEETVRL